MNPFSVVVGTFTTPVVTNAAGRAIFTRPTEEEKKKDGAYRSLVGKFALLNAGVAIGLGLLGSRTSNEMAKDLALGGAIGTGVLAGILGTTYVLAKPEDKPAETPPTLPMGAGPGGLRSPDWVSQLVGY